MHTSKLQMMMKMKLNGISSNDVDFMYELLVCIFTGRNHDLNQRLLRNVQGILTKDDEHIDIVLIRHK